MSPSNDKVLLLFRKKHPYQDHFALIGGKTEHNETLKESLFRETLEESQVRLQSATPCFILNEYYFEQDQLKGHFLIHYWLSQGSPFPKRDFEEGILEWFPLDALPDRMVPSDQKVLDFVHQNPEKIGLGDCILKNNGNGKLYLDKWIVY